MALVDEWVPVLVADQRIMAESVKVFRRLHVARIRRRGRSGHRWYEMIPRHSSEWSRNTRWRGELVTLSHLTDSPTRVGVEAFTLESGSGRPTVAVR